MSKELDRKSNSVLNFRPIIEFIEPEQESVKPEPIPSPLPPEDFDKRRERLLNLANAVDVLATAVQARIDTKAKNIKIKLHPVIDSQAVQALRREFPDADDGYITYDQYKHCKDKVRGHGLKNAQKIIPSVTDIQFAKTGLDKTFLGGFESPEAKDGSLRPELSEDAALIEPINLDEFQNELIKILVNFIWKKFIKPTFKPIMIPGLGSLADLLPDELATVSNSFKKQLSSAKDKGVEVL